MAIQKTSSKVNNGTTIPAPVTLDDSRSPALVQLVRLLARSAAKEALDASLIKPTDASDAKD